VSLSLPHHPITATWHDDILTHGNFLIFFKKIQNNNNKKIQKIEELTRGNEGQT